MRDSWSISSRGAGTWSAEDEGEWFVQEQQVIKGGRDSEPKEIKAVGRGKCRQFRRHADKESGASGKRGREDGDDNDVERVNATRGG